MARAVARHATKIRLDLHQTSSRIADFTARLTGPKIVEGPDAGGLLGDRPSLVILRSDVCIEAGLTAVDLRIHAPIVDALVADGNAIRQRIGCAANRQDREQHEG